MGKVKSGEDLCLRCRVSLNCVFSDFAFIEAVEAYGNEAKPRKAHRPNITVGVMECERFEEQ